MNPFEALASYILGRIQQKVYQAWMRLVFQIAVSMAGSFLFMAGTVMIGAVAKCPPSAALVLGLGSGMISAAVILVYYLRCSPLTRGMIFVFPAQEALQELQTDFQVINTQGLGQNPNHEQ